VRRLALNLLTCLSLLLAAASAALWVRSYVAHDVVCVSRGWRHVVIHSLAGAIFVTDNDPVTELPWSVSHEREDVVLYDNYPPSSLTEFSFRAGIPGWPGIRWHLQFPHWAAVVAACLLPAIRLAMRWRRRPSARGFPVDARPPTA
jgi:hypothetical protein